MLRPGILSPTYKTVHQGNIVNKTLKTHTHSDFSWQWDYKRCYLCCRAYSEGEQPFRNKLQVELFHCKLFRWNVTDHLFGLAQFLVFTCEQHTLEVSISIFLFDTFCYFFCIRFCEGKKKQWLLLTSESLTEYTPCPFLKLQVGWQSSPHLSKWIEKVCTNVTVIRLGLSASATIVL